MSTANKKQFSKLVDAYLKGKASSKERSFIEQYYDLFSDGDDVFETMDRTEVRAVGDRLKARIDATLQYKEKPNFTLRWRYISVAATILLAAAMGIYFYKLNQPKLKASILKTKMLADISPGGNKAILTLANGNKISLTDAQLGKVANEKGAVINKTKDGQLVYQSTSSNNEKLIYNSVQTPKGGQYQLTLPDGTQVWLNAASMLKYPVAFSGKERMVELTGEAYFEVAKDKNKRFVVSTANQSVEVLGTHFNINSYTDEIFTKTTLIEGSVKVKNSSSGLSAVIRPGQQALLSTDHPIRLKEVDLDEAIAWKNGYFMFDEESLESILRKVSRWYDVDIQYQNSDLKKKLLFSGTLSRYSNVSKVLKKLELTESVQFKIEGRKIIVLP